MKNVKGITLIALVVTIIVLLILAGISISIAVNGGIIGRAKQSTTSYSASKGQEELQLKLTEYKMDAETGTVGDLKTYLEGNGADAVEEDGDNLDVTYQGYVYTVNKTNMSIEGEPTKAGPRPSTSIVVKDGSGNAVTTEDSIKNGSTLTINVESTFAEGTITGISQKNADGSTIALTVIGVNTGNASTTLNVTANGSYSFVISYKLADGTTTGASNKTFIVNQFESAATATTVEGAIAEGKYYDKNTAITDSSETPATVKVPAGFKIASDSATTVAGGVVIEDVSAGDSTSVGNQFVWIPCTLDGANGSVELGRYTFSTTDGTPTLAQVGSNYAENVAINPYYHELQTSSYENTKAKSLANFVTSVGTNGGYYLARYEAGKTTDTSKCVSKKNVAVYNNITQPKCATIARNMYSANVTSDLVNSYAWDTAIVYIEKCGTNTNYANQKGESTDDNLANTGITKLKSTSAIDVQCNIYDMEGSVCEWTTESSSYTGAPCVLHGGNYHNSTYFTVNRVSDTTSNAYGSLGFRPLLYL